MTCLLKTTEVILVDWVLGRWALGGRLGPNKGARRCSVGRRGPRTGWSCEGLAPPAPLSWPPPPAGVWRPLFRIVTLFCVCLFCKYSSPSVFLVEWREKGHPYKHCREEGDAPRVVSSDKGSWFHGLPVTNGHKRSQCLVTQIQHKLL